MHNYKRILSVITVLCLLVVIVSRCVNEKEHSNDPRGRAFAGSAACNSCHKDIHQSWINAAHSMTTSIASRNTIKGNFTSPQNEYFYRPEVKVVLEKRDTSYYQVAYQNDSEKR